MSESCPPWAARAAGPAVMTCPSSRVVVIASASSTSDGGGAPVPNSSLPPVGSPEPPALPLCKAMVLDPRMGWPAVSRDTSVPPTVTSGAPGVKAVPPMEVLSGVAVMT